MAVRKAKHVYRMRTCEVCGREYPATPEQVGRSIIYRDACRWCGAYDRIRGIHRLKLNHHETQEFWNYDPEPIARRAYGVYVVRSWLEWLEISVYDA